MAFRINFLQINQPIKGDVLPMEGNPVADYATTSPATAPVGTQYITVEHDGAAEVQVDNLKGVLDGYQNKKFGRLNAGFLNVPNVVEGSVITVTEA